MMKFRPKGLGCVHVPSQRLPWYLMRIAFWGLFQGVGLSTSSGSLGTKGPSGKNSTAGSRTHFIFSVSFQLVWPRDFPREPRLQIQIQPPGKCDLMKLRSPVRTPPLINHVFFWSRLVAAVWHVWGFILACSRGNQLACVC